MSRIGSQVLRVITKRKYFHEHIPSYPINATKAPLPSTAATTTTSPRVYALLLLLQPLLLVPLSNLVPKKATPEILFSNGRQARVHPSVHRPCSAGRPAGSVCLSVRQQK